MKSISVIQTATAAAQFLWKTRKELLQTIAVPLTLTILFDLFDTSDSEDHPLVFWGWAVAQFTLFVWITVCIHKLILGKKPNTQGPKRSTVSRTMSYGAWTILLTLCLVAALMFFWSFLRYVLVNTPYSHGEIGPFTPWLLVPATLLASYIPARMCLALPAVALGRNKGATWSWNMTKGNGWRVALLVYLLPWTFYIVLGTLDDSRGPWVVRVGTSFLFALIIVTEVALLSFIYKELTSQIED